MKKNADELEKQRVVLKPDVIAKREKDLQDEYVELQGLFSQLQQDLAKQEAQLTRDIFAKTSSIIDSIAKRDGYTMILEKNESAVLWADTALDITAEVDKRIDAGEGGPVAARRRPRPTRSKLSEHAAPTRWGSYRGSSHAAKQRARQAGALRLPLGDSPCFCEAA